MNPGEIVVLDITGLNSAGEGIARYGEEGFVVFVKGALPGERVRCRITKTARRYAVASAVTIESPSAERVLPPCPVFGRCGGCQLQHASYKLQLEIKSQILHDALRRIGGIELAAPVACVPSPKEWGYRNKTTLPVRRSPRKEGAPLIGYYETNSHRIVPFRGCAVLEPCLERTVRDMAALIAGSGLKGYEESKGTGDVRHIAARCNSLSVPPEILAGIVVAGDLTARRRGKLKNMSQALLRRADGLGGLVLNVKHERDNFIWGSVFNTLGGKRLLRQHLCGFGFDVDMTSFFQVNTAQAENMFSRVREFVRPFGARKAVELFSGVGSLTAFIAGDCGEIDSVEEWRPAAKLQSRNMLMNGIGNVRVCAQSAEKYIESAGSCDIAVLDPPRSGLSESVAEGLKRLRPRGIVYVSCNPATLARDIARFMTGGDYRLQTVEAFDMFPQTAHVEALALLSLA